MIPEAKAYTITYKGSTHVLDLLSIWNITTPFGVEQRINLMLIVQTTARLWGSQIGRIVGFLAYTE